MRRIDMFLADLVRAETVRTASALGFVVALAAATAGCGAGSGGEDAGTTLGNLFAYNSLKAPPFPQAQKAQVAVDCPIVQVADGQASYRAYTGADHSSAGVRYQYSIGDVARECIASPDGRIEIRVGVAGYVLAGPSGASGTFNVPVKVVVRSEKDQSIVASKVYRVATSIPPGDSQATFSTVSEPLVVPYLREAADEDYSIYVGFDGPGGDAPQKRTPRRRRG